MVLRIVERAVKTLGTRTAGYFGRQGKGFDRFDLVVPARGGASAEVRIYAVQDRLPPASNSLTQIRIFEERV